MRRQRLLLTDPISTSDSSEDAAPAVALPLHLKYRPTTLDQVLGQDAAVASIRTALKSKNKPHAFLFTGPSGVGKTTLARIVGQQLGCTEHNTIETDAATNTGIDDMRRLTEGLFFQAFGDSPNKMVIIDECHALSKAAWQSLLKVVEEPPPHVFFAFCTTEASKVPATIVTRCHAYTLKAVKASQLEDLLLSVITAEGWEVNSSIVSLVARESQGSPRLALVNLSRVLGSTSKEEAAELLQSSEGDADVIELARMVAFGRRDFNWFAARDLVVRIKEQNPEAVRIVIVNYLNACVLGAKSENDVKRLLAALDQFMMGPLNPADKWAPILIALGNLTME